MKKIVLLSYIVFFSYIIKAQQIGNGWTYPISDFSSLLNTGAYEANNPIDGVPEGGFQHLFVLRHSNQSNNHQFQIGTTYTENDRLFFRKIATGLAPKSTTWNELATRGSNTFTGNQTIMGNVSIGLNDPLEKFEVLKNATTNGNDIVALFRRSAVNTGGSSILRLGGNTSTADFEVNSGYDSQGHRFGTYFDLNIVNNNTYQSNLYGGINFVANSNVRMTIKPSGYVGIGTDQPSAKLDVDGDIVFGQNQKYNMLTGRYAGAAIKMGTSSSTWDRNMHLGFIDNNKVFSSVLSLIHETGFVGIGTKTPDQMLTVNGAIHAKEVLVDMDILADYVFSPDYSLMPLNKVEAFVKTNKHLPAIPSAAEVKKKGLSMGEMQNKLLQKIEELTLYVIEQQKQIEQQNEEITKLKMRN